MSNHSIWNSDYFLRQIEFVKLVHSCQEYVHRKYGNSGVVPQLPTIVLTAYNYRFPMFTLPKLSEAMQPVVVPVEERTVLFRRKDSVDAAFIKYLNLLADSCSHVATKMTTKEVTFAHCPSDMTSVGGWRGYVDDLFKQTHDAVTNEKA